MIYCRSLAEQLSFSSKWSPQARCSAGPTAESSSCDLRDKMARWMRRKKSVEAFKPSESARQDVEEESVTKERRWKWPSFYALIVLSWRALGYRTKAKVLLVVETQHQSRHTFCNDREWVGRGMDVFTFRTWSWGLLWENDRWRSLHQEEPTPVADVARSGSYSEPRKLKLQLIFFQIPNHWRKCQAKWRCTDGFFFHIFLSHFTVYMYFRGGRGSWWGANMRHLALPQETEGRPATSLHVTHGDQNDPVNDINHRLNMTCRGWALPSGNWSCVSTKMIPTPGEQ